MRDASSERRHARGTCTTTRWKDISDGHVLNECRVEAGFGINCAKNFTEDFLWPCVLETTTLSLRESDTLLNGSS
jgi:hypothetical protein